MRNLCAALLSSMLFWGCNLLVPPPQGASVEIETVLENLNSAVALAFAPDGRIFFTEKEGALRVIQNGELLDEPAATFAVDPAGERGLLGLALHPNFAENQWVYLYYTSGEGSLTAVDNRVVRITLDGNQITGTETLIASLPVGDTLTIHNGGNIRFGPDGKLYVAIGDVGDTTTAQDPDALAGSILRYNDDGTIPEDNPFGSDSATYAIGLRNPFDLVFEPASGQLFATENSTNANDEINRIVAGGNYGWPEVIGTANGSFRDPLLDLGDSSVVPTGIDVAPNDRYGSETVNNLFYGEFLTGRVYRVDLSEDGTTVDSRELFVEGVVSVTDVAFSSDGTLYILTINSLLRALPAESTP